MQKQIVPTNIEFKLPLTKNKSYETVVFPGQGYFWIGTEGITKEKCEVLLEANEEINWDAFNGYYVPGDWEYRDEIPYGDWPRFFRYYGNDNGFIEWSKKRRIEEFEWYLYEDKKAEFTDASIGRLLLHIKESKLECTIGKKTHDLELFGNLENFKIKKCGNLRTIGFHPEYENNIDKYQLPTFEAFKDATDIIIMVPVASSPFDCESLLQFKNLKELSLIGNMTNLHALEKLEYLEGIWLHNIPNIENFPHLTTWKNLKHFSAIDIEKEAGLHLRKEAKELQERIDKDDIGIYGLKPLIWFETKYGIPFKLWEEESKKIATKAYKKLYDEIRKTKEKSNIKTSFINYIQKFSELDKISEKQKKDIDSSINKIVESLEIKSDLKEIKQSVKEIQCFGRKTTLKKEMNNKKNVVQRRKKKTENQSKNIDRGLQILFDTYFGKYGWKDGTISEEDFKIAKEEGYMFAYPKSLTHEEVFEKRDKLIKQIKKEKVAASFLSSLVTGKLEYRSILGSYWYANSVPKHECKNFERRCWYCNLHQWREKPDERELKTGVNVLNFERYKWGGVRHDTLDYAIFDLEQFLKLPEVTKEEVEEGKKILLSMLHCIDDLNGLGKAGTYRDYLVKQKIIKENRNNIGRILNILGVVGILSGEDAPSYYEDFTPAWGDRRDPAEYKNDFVFPVNRWKVKDGVNKKMFKLVFGFDYE